MPIFMDPIMMSYLGLNPKSTNYDDYQKAIMQFTKIRPYIRAFHNSLYINNLANGNVCAAVGWSGDIIIAQQRAMDAAEPIRIGYLNPKEGHRFLLV